MFEFTIAVMGPPAVGKSTLIQRLAPGTSAPHVRQIETTHGWVSLRLVETPWDRRYVARIHGPFHAILYMCDLTQSATCEQVLEFQKEMVPHPELIEVICGNKYDLSGDIRVSSETRLLLVQGGIPYSDVSVTTGWGIHWAVLTLLRKLRDDLELKFINDCWLDSNVPVDPAAPRTVEVITAELTAHQKVTLAAHEKFMVLSRELMAAQDRERGVAAGL